MQAAGENIPGVAVAGLVRLLSILRNEPMMALGSGLNVVVLMIAAFAPGLSLTPVQMAAVGTISTALTSASAAFLATPVQLGVINSAVTTTLVAAAAFGLHMTPAAIALAGGAVSSGLSYLMREKLTPSVRLGRLVPEPEGVLNVSEATCSPVPDIFPSLSEEEVYLVIGGVMTSVLVVNEAHEILAGAPGLMVRQPLARYRNPLALCDYHAEAAPYRASYYSSLEFRGKGAAGRPATKHAFMHALRCRSADAMREAPLIAAMPLAAEAYDAMRADVSYVMAMSKMAVSVLAKQHAWRLRSELRQAQQDAMKQCQRQAGEFTCENQSSCGTGECRFACGIYKSVTAPAGDGKTARPANHAGGPYSTDSALAALEVLRPFRVKEALEQ